MPDKEQIESVRDFSKQVVDLAGFSDDLVEKLPDIVGSLRNSNYYEGIDDILGEWDRLFTKSRKLLERSDDRFYVALANANHNTPVLACTSDTKNPQVAYYAVTYHDAVLYCLEGLLLFELFDDCRDLHPPERVFKESTLWMPNEKIDYAQKLLDSQLSICLASDLYARLEIELLRAERLALENAPAPLVDAPATLVEGSSPTAILTCDRFKLSIDLKTKMIHREGIDEPLCYRRRPSRFAVLLAFVKAEAPLNREKKEELAEELQWNKDAIDSNITSNVYRLNQDLPKLQLIIRAKDAKSHDAQLRCIKPDNPP